MTRCLGLVVLLTALCATSQAAPWAFSDPVDVSRTHGERVFHHLGSGGRNGIAVSASRVGVAWEDNRDGLSRCYIAITEAPGEKFSTEHRVSGDGPCYEPALVGLGDGRFAIAWEEADAVWVRMLGPDEVGPGVSLAGPQAAHVALALSPEKRLFAVWSEKSGPHFQVRIGELQTTDPNAAPTLLGAIPVEPGDPRDAQTYPALAVSPDGDLLVGWEDRRGGHTVIVVAASRARRDFAPPAQINESFWGGRELGAGRGTGAMRVSLVALPDGEVIAVWADKRDFRSGYDVYAAWKRGGDPLASFGPNQKVQDSFADGVAQWHPTVASGPGMPGVVVAWDDDRDGSPDVWISWPEEGGWSDDLEPPGAAGPGAQVEPAIALDNEGNLHLAWVDRNDLNSPSRIRYLYARRNPPE